MKYSKHRAMPCAWTTRADLTNRADGLRPGRWNSQGLSGFDRGSRHFRQGGVKVWRSTAEKQHLPWMASGRGDGEARATRGREARPVAHRIKRRDVGNPTSMASGAMEREACAGARSHPVRPSSAFSTSLAVRLFSMRNRAIQRTPGIRARIARRTRNPGGIKPPRKPSGNTASGPHANSGAPGS